MLMTMINKPDIRKEKHLNSYSFVLVKHSALKQASKLFRPSMKSDRSRIRKEKYNRDMIRIQLDEISLI